MIEENNERFEKLVGKNVEVHLLNQFFYMGKLLSFEDKHLEINDRFRGKLFLHIDSVASIMEIKNGDNEKWQK